MGSVVGNTWTWRIASSYSGISFDYYIFDVAPVASDNLQVFNAAGFPLLTTPARKPLRVAVCLSATARYTTCLARRTRRTTARAAHGQAQLVWGSGENEIEEIDDTNYAWWEGVFSHANGIGVGGVYTRKDRIWDRRR